MTDYTFESLNDKEFEHLVRDLLQKEMQVTFEDFKPGQDQGIDLRHAKSADNEIIVQCKHWLKSGFSKLKYHLKNEELEKVKKLQPKRYVLVTSLPLSPKDKEDIIEIFSSFIKKPSDIIGKETLNNFLGKYEEIEENHYKLWLSSKTIIKKISTEYIRERSELYKNVLTEKIKLFVKTESFDIAEEILDNYNVLLITGEPGIGKTMLADYLTFKYLKEGFELTYIYNNLTDAEKVFDPQKKQIFYFDDFLGKTFLEILSEKRFDSQISHLVKAIRDSPNHYLILTSRTTIYNAAKYKSEVLDDDKFNTLNYKIEISDYNYRDRGKILYNHLFFSNLDDQYKTEIKSNEFYFEIIKHENFNPRIIEFITDKERIQKSNPDDYSKFILESLNNPTQIWNKAFQNQISDLDKIFLLTLYSFKLPVKENKFKSALSERYQLEVEKSGREIPHNCYQKSLKILLDGFVKRFYKKYYYDKHFYLEFINPSVEDFLSSYLKNNKEECLRILNSAKYYEQIQNLFIAKYSPLSSVFQFSELEERIRDLIIEVDEYNLPDHLLILEAIYGTEKAKNIIADFLPELLIEESIGSPEAIKLFNRIYDHEFLKEVVNDNLTAYANYLVSSIRDFMDLEDVISFLDKTDLDTYNFIKKNSDEILRKLTDYIEEHIHETDLGHIEPEIRYDPRYGYDRGDMHALISEAIDERIDMLIGDFEALGVDYDAIMAFDFKRLKPDMDKMIEKLENDLAASHEAELYSRRSSTSGKISYNDRSFIKNLFS